MNIPSFFEDNSQSKDRELMLDYFLAWTLRCAQESNKMDKLRIASKNILSFFLSENLVKYKIENVYTWKQWNQIDLRAEIIMKDENNKPRKVALLFENKMYTHLRADQLNKYKNKFESFYKTKENEKDYELKYYFLTCHYEEKQLKSDFEEARNCGYIPLRFDHIKSGSTLVEKTGNYMFDEFWFNYF